MDGHEVDAFATRRNDFICDLALDYLKMPARLIERGVDDRIIYLGRCRGFRGHAHLFFLL